MPCGTVELTETVTFARANGSVEFKIMVLGEIVTVGPIGDTLPVIATTPENPFRLVALTRKEPEDPCASPISLAGDGVCNENVGRLANIAVWILSIFGVGVPFAIVTQIPPPTLVVEHPVWNPTVVAKVAPVTL